MICFARDDLNFIDFGFYLFNTESYNLCRFSSEGVWDPHSTAACHGHHRCSVYYSATGQRNGAEQVSSCAGPIHLVIIH